MRVSSGAVGALAEDHDVALPPFLDEGSIISGGCCRSASMMTTASPRAWSSPAAMAISLPKLRLKDTAPMRGSAALAARMRVERFVAAAVVDEDDLPMRRDPLEDRDQALAQRGDIRALVEDGDDDAEFGRRHFKDPRCRAALRAEFVSALKGATLRACTGNDP